MNTDTHFVQAQSVIDSFVQDFSDRIEKKLKDEVFRKFSDIMLPGRVYKTTVLRHEIYDLDSLYGVNYFGEGAYILAYRLYFRDITEEDQKERQVGG